MTVSHVSMTLTVAVDWDNDGSFVTAGDDISSVVKNVRITTGIVDPLSHIAGIGSCDIVVNNLTRNFSPLYSSGTYYGKLLPGRQVKVTVGDGVTTWTIFRGVTRAITPLNGQYGERSCVISCEDYMATLQDVGVSIPLQNNVLSSTLAAHVVNACFLAPVATGTITIAAGNAANNDTVTVNGQVITFKTTLSGGSDEVKIGAANTDTALNLCDAINRKQGLNGTTYASNMTPITTVTASVSSNVVTITSTLRGAVGNAYTLSDTGANITVSGATLSGGSDYPSAVAPSYQTGVRTFTVGADEWTAETTNGMTALQQIVDSEWGYFWCARDGTLTFKNGDYIFTANTGAAALTLSSEQNGVEGTLDQDSIYNYIDVQYSPRYTLSSGVVAQSRGQIQVPGQTGLTERYNTTQALTQSAGDVVVKLPFTDPTTGAPMSASSLTTPLVATTDFTLSEFSDGSGDITTSYSSAGIVVFSCAIAGANCEIAIRNYALGPIYINTLKVRGTGLVKYNPTHVLREDTTSRAAYGKRAIAVDIPLPSTQQFAEGLADYLLARYKDPTYRITSISFNNYNKVGSVNLFSLNLGDVIQLQDYQLGITSNQKYLIIGISYDAIGEKTTGPISFNVIRLDDTFYGVYDDATYGLYDSAKYGI